MKTTILLIRHGQSEGNLAGVFTGHSGYSLTPLGYQQAARTAECIRKKYSVSAVYSSDLPRAFQTAEQIAKAFALTVVTDFRLREIFAGDWENVAFDDLCVRYPTAYEVWRKNLGYARCTNGEAVLEVAQRMGDTIRELVSIYEGQTIVIVSHATPIRATLWKASGKDIDVLQEQSWGSNCAISELVCENGVLSIGYSNYTDHLAGVETSLPTNI